VKTAPVTAIVVNFDTGAHVVRCLECLAAQTVPAEAIVVIDNASRDGSAAACERAIAGDQRLAGRARLERLATNVGFAAATNRGIALARTEWVALVNPDAFPEPDWLERLLAAAAAHPDCAAFGSRQMIAGRPGMIDGLGDRYHVGGLAWREGHGRRLRPADLVPREIFSPCAAAALYRREALVEVGGCDEDFFCYFEDVDLGFRLRLAGHHARLVPDAVVHHVGGASAGGAGGARATYFGHRNLVWTLLKNMPAALLPVSLLVHLPQTILTGVLLAGRGRGGAFVRARWDAARRIGECRRKRRAVQAARRATTAAIWRALDKGIWRR